MKQKKDPHAFIYFMLVDFYASLLFFYPEDRILQRRNHEPETCFDGSG